jgi:FkbM family methyltransferase
MLRVIKSLFPTVVKNKVKDHLGVPSLSATLKRLKSIGWAPKTVFDIGAYKGFWALDYLKIFKNAEIYMFEAQRSKEETLKSLCSNHPSLHYCIALLGHRDGEYVSFVEEETASYVDVGSVNARTYVTKSLDNLITELHCPYPDFIKLDVQGYELEVLKGGKKALSFAEFCLLEVTLLDIGGACPLLLEVINFMEIEGFQAYDISQFIRRPFDKALWQIDLLFVKKDSIVIASKTWI